MIKKRTQTNFWEVMFSQSNSYHKNVLKTKEELLNKQKISTTKSNMKKITINIDALDLFLKDLNMEFDGVKPSYSSRFFIEKNKIINTVNSLKDELGKRTLLFRGENVAFEIDSIILTAPEKIYGHLCISLRDLNRKEVVLSFGNFVNNKFIDSKKDLFNHSIYSCAYDTFTKLTIDPFKKELIPKINFSNLMLDRKDFATKGNRSTKEQWKK